MQQLKDLLQIVEDPEADAEDVRYAVCAADDMDLICVKAWIFFSPLICQSAFEDMPFFSVHENIMVDWPHDVYLGLAVHFNGWVKAYITYWYGNDGLKLLNKDFIKISQLGMKTSWRFPEGKF